MPAVWYAVVTTQRELYVEDMSDAERVLRILRAHEGLWVADLYRRAGVMVHSRIADLRRRGHQIECRRFGQGDYRYRLREEKQ